jgi:5-methylcytosine-specific restriction endonuclease McrBC GTP-binding regulatory subunit McrB
MSINNIVDTSTEKSIGTYINKGKNNIFALNNVCEFETVNDVTIPTKNFLLSKYRDLINSVTKNLELSDKEFSRYKFKPKTLSYDLYETTELWYLLLFINNMTSVTQFNRQKIKVIDPYEIDNIIYVIQNENYRKQKKENGL